jgi:hypothetical protein
MGVRNGKNYMAALVLVALTSVVTLAIADVARTVKDAPVNKAVQAEQIKQLRQQVEGIEKNQRDFKRSVDQEFESIEKANAELLREIQKANAVLQQHIASRKR